jgi:hypothetical protein
MFDANREQTWLLCIRLSLPHLGSYSVRLSSFVSTIEDSVIHLWYVIELVVL